MALTPGAMQGNPPAPPPNAPQEPQPHGAGVMPRPGPLHQPLPEDASPQDRLAYALENWAIYPEVYGAGQQEQVLPIGMFPWESPLVRGARAEVGENPHEPPEDFAVIRDAVLGRRPPDEPTPGTVAPAGHQDARDAARERAEHRAAQAAQARQAPPAASQH
jgi:hypothetical protein